MLVDTLFGGGRPRGTPSASTTVVFSGPDGDSRHQPTFANGPTSTAMTLTDPDADRSLASTPE